MFPRVEKHAECGICGCPETLTAAEEIPDDFALRLYSEGRLEAAVRFLEERVARGEATARDCLNLAWISLVLQDYRAVETWCHESERLDEVSPEPHLLLGRVLERSERWQEAVEEYDAALRRAVLEGERLELVSRLREECRQRIPEW